MKLITKESIVQDKCKPNRKFAYVSLILFLISPIVALPFIIMDIYKRKRASLFIFSMFVGILTYLLLPDWSLDLARYYQAYERISHYNLSEFVEFLELTTDYVFYFLFFLFSRFGLKFQLLLFCLSTFNFYVVFYVFDKISCQYRVSNRTYFNNFVLLFFSIGILYYLSATRFVLAGTFFILFIYKYYFQGKKKVSWVFLLVSVLTHISLLIYLPFIIILPKIKNKKTLIIVSTVILILISVVPVNLVIQNLSSFLPGFANKAFIYLIELRDKNWYLLISNNVIILISLFFVFFYYKKIPSKILNPFLLVFLPVAITWPFGLLVYDRYMIIFKIVFTLIVIATNFHLINKNRLVYFILRRSLYAPFILYFMYSIYLYRANILPYFTIDSLFLFSILKNTYTVNDFLLL